MGHSVTRLPLCIAAALVGVLLIAPSADAAYQLQASWGGQGSAAGQFNNPGMAGVSPDGGTIYVADTGNNRVELFTADGGFLDQFGAGQLSAPSAVAVGPDGTVYVTDTGNNRVVRYSSDGRTVLTQWGTPGSLDGQFNAPTGIAVGGDGSVYVGDSGNRRLQRFLDNGTHVATINAGGFQSVQGVAVGADGSVYVVDPGGARVQRFDASNNPQSGWGTAGGGDGQFISPRGIAATSQGVYVADASQSRIQKFTTSGAFLDALDASVDPALSAPVGIAVSSIGAIYVSQTSGGRVARYGETGTGPGGGDGGGSLPPPKTGERANAVPTEGTVRVRRPGSSSFELLKESDQIPIGSIVDVTDGEVSLTTTASATTTQTAVFFDGVFQLFQDKKRRPVTELRLYGGNFRKGCPRTRGQRASTSASRKKKVVRQLWGKGKGRFRTKGRYSAASIRGTEWLTQDRCDGTNVRVKEGSVTVRDLVNRRNKVVKAPRSFFVSSKKLDKKSRR
jgi:sugar lactone lactonase YvrE